MFQGELFDDIPELKFWTRIVTGSKKIALQRLPHPVEGQSIDEYQDELQIETMLEMAYILKRISEHLEEKALQRQNLNIQLKYEAKND